MTGTAERPAQLVRDEFLTAILERDAFSLDAGALPRDELPDGVAGRRAFVQAKVGVGDLIRVARLERIGFRLIDTNVIFDRAPSPPLDVVGRVAVRPATPADREPIVALAGRAFRFSRFHLDPDVPRETAHRIKSHWVANYWAGTRGEHMLVAEEKGRPIGFLQLLHRGQVLTIDLISTDPDHRRMGAARDLIAFALRTITGVERVTVGTQIANVPSVRLYENLGFRLSRAMYVFHFHGSP